MIISEYYVCNKGKQTSKEMYNSLSLPMYNWVKSLLFILVWKFSLWIQDEHKCSHHKEEAEPLNNIMSIIKTNTFTYQHICTIEPLQVKPLTGGVTKSSSLRTHSSWDYFTAKMTHTNLGLRAVKRVQDTS